MTELAKSETGVSPHPYVTVGYKTQYYQKRSQAQFSCLCWFIFQVLVSVSFLALPLCLPDLSTLAIYRVMPTLFVCYVALFFAFRWKRDALRTLEAYNLVREDRLMALGNPSLQILLDMFSSTNAARLAVICSSLFMAGTAVIILAISFYNHGRPDSASGQPVQASPPVSASVPEAVLVRKSPPSNQGQPQVGVKSRPKPGFKADR